MRPSSQIPNGMVPDRDDALRHVTQIVAEQMGRRVDEVVESNTLIEDLGCDSLDIVEISMELEEHFDISIPDEFGAERRTIGDVADGVLRLLAGSRPS